MREKREVRGEERKMGNDKGKGGTNLLQPLPGRGPDETKRHNEGL